MSRASGIGSWPGEDVHTAIQVVRDLLTDTEPPGLPYLPELPDRGPGADMVGRTAGLLVGLPVDLQPEGWRLVDRPGMDAGRTAARWRQDLDELAEAYDGYTGELKLQVAGPWTLATSLWLPRGERALLDEGACRDLADSLAEGLREHLTAVSRVVPGAEPVVQLDEPSLPAALAGRIRTASGYGRLPAIEPGPAADALRRVLAAAGQARTVIHCCARDVPLPLLRSTGSGAIALDTTLLDERGWESVAATVEAGVELWAGVDADPERGAAEVAGELSAPWRRVGLPLRDLDHVTVTPTCGLAGLDGGHGAARRAQATVTDVASALTDLVHG